MNKQEAIALMKQGAKITHRLFTRDEWIRDEPLVNVTSRIIDEDGFAYTYDDFFEARTSHRWDDGYSVWEPLEKPMTATEVMKSQKEQVNKAREQYQQSESHRLMPLIFGAMMMEVNDTGELTRINPVTTKTTSTDNVIRQMIMSDPEKVRELLLTNAARNAVMTVAQNGDAGVTAAEWARRFDDSIQSASQKLKSLWSKGYLTREEMVSPSGGIHHLYKINEELGL